MRNTVLVVILCMAPWCVADEPKLAILEGTNPAQWRLVWKTDPARQATISWNTAEPGTQHRVHLKPDGTDQFTIVDCQRNGQYTDKQGKTDLYYHHARLTGLQPATQYTVVLESDGRRSPEFYFITAPDDDRQFQLLFGGDSRSDRAMRQKMNQMLGGLLAEHPAIVGFAHGGDYIATGSSLPQWSSWMSDHELTATADGRLLPIIPTRGNHDLGPLFDEIFDFPPGDTNYYATDLGSQVRLITLNTEISAAGDQAAWLEKELAAARPAKRWLLVQYHRPAFPAIKPPSAARRSWVPLFEKYDVDLVLEADGHNIKRTVPIRDNKMDPTGVTYVGEGGLGVRQRTPLWTWWYLKPPGMSGVGHHVQLLDFDQDKLICHAILHGGEVADEVTLTAREQQPRPQKSTVQSGAVRN